jgi:3-dehydroquinate synthase
VGEVNVSLGATAYTIHIEAGNIYNIGRWMRELNLSGKVLVVSDENVGRLYGDNIIDILQASNYKAELICVPPGEDAKALSVAMELYTKAITMGLDRQSSIIALGGGVVGDLAGFVAATYLRGVPFIQIPTSLLAQVDSSVGGKVAVNHSLGKNLIGAFYQPQAVFIDTNLLSTLPERELYTGLAEVIKYGIIADRDFFYFLLADCQKILTKETFVLNKLIHRSCEIKANVVEQDERELSLRMILNFGHTIAHAVETDTGFHHYNHGEAVAIGMYGAALISYYLEMCNQAAVNAVRSIIEQFQLPVVAPECKVEDLFGLLARDKKTVGGKTNWILMNEIGTVTVRSDVPDAIVRRVLAEITQFA